MADERFDPATVTKAAEDTFTVRRVFGEAYEREGVLVIPVARVMGMVGLGAGGGRGSGLPTAAGRRRPGGAEPAADDAAATTGEGEGHGGGGGYGAGVKPLGVYVVDADGAHWQPAVDWNRVVLGGQMLGAWALAMGFAAWAIAHRRR